MPEEAWLQTNRNAAIASTGAPRSSHNWRMCARGSSPRHIATMGLRNPSPTSDSTRIAVSMAAFTRGKRGASSKRLPGVGGVAASAPGFDTTASGGCAFTLLADDIAALDLLLALEAEDLLLDVRVRFAAVVFDAVDELPGRRAEAVGREVEVGGVHLLLRDQRFRSLVEHVGAIRLLRRLEVPRI